MSQNNLPQAQTKTHSLFDNFVNKYALSKTLRFELKPYEEEEGKSKTRGNLKKMAGINANSVFSNFLHDQEIEDSYQILKPVFDKIHEEFITNSLRSKEAKEMDFSEYFNLYLEWAKLKKEKANAGENEKDKIEEKINKIYNEGKAKGEIQQNEDRLRKAFELAFENEGKRFKLKMQSLLEEDENQDDDQEDENKKGFRKLLKAKIVLDYIKKYVDEDNFPQIESIEGVEISKEQIKNALGKFTGFSTYFGGFEINRINYYVTKDEKATAVATRIINENLPKFCDNILTFEKHKEDYLKIYDFFKERGNVLKGKNQNGTERDLQPISNDIFQIDRFSNCLSQKEIEEYNLKIGDANYQINQYNQLKIREEKDLPKNQKNFKKLSQFKTLYKQIGCGDKGDFIPSIKSFEKLVEILKKVSNDSKNYLENVDNFCNYLRNHESFENIFWSDKAINTISSKYFANWYTLKSDIWGKRDRKGNIKDEETKIPKAVELKELFEVLDKIENWKDGGVLFKQSLFEKGSEEKNKIIKESIRPSNALLEMIFLDIENNKIDFHNLTQKVLAISDNIKDEDKQNIKQWLDCLLFTNQIIKYWKVKEKFSTESNLDEQIKNIIFSENNPTRFYDIIRNFLTKKPQSEVNKLKLNFKNSTLAGGWDVNKEKDNFCIILQDPKENQYLAILQNEYKNIFEQTNDNPLYDDDNLGWKKMNYKLIPGASKTLPKIFFSKKWLANNPIPLEVKKIKDQKSFKKGENFNKQDLHKLIDFYKENLKKYPNEKESWAKTFNFNFSGTKKYESIDQFYIEVDKQGYKIDLIPVNKNYLEQLISDGKIYLFAIRNKDYNLVNNKKKETKKNLHTLYWQSIFKDIENRPKLNGEAEIFYRPALSQENINLLKTTDKKGKEIIKNYRFSKEKFIFHCPITLNFCLKSSRLNDEINEKLSNNKSVCFLGIDRGEKHLAYYSLINQEGEILDQGTLNIPFIDKDGKPRNVKAKKYFLEDKEQNPDGTIEWKPREVECKDYNELLEAMASNRDIARKNWTTIGTIKELKEGYISQVIREIVNVAVQNNAFIIFEKLNIGFKRGRQKIEKQVYQKLELALAKKLNYLVDKRAVEGQVGSVTQALQLTPPVNNFSEIENSTQFGIMLYTRADYTSQTDPKTGWRKTVYLKKGSEEYIKNQILENFDDFGFDGEDYYFTYTDKNTEKKWTLFSGKNGKSLGRFYRELKFENSEKQWTPKEQNLAERLDKIFKNFDFKRENSAKKQILEGDEIKLEKYRQEDQNPWESLRFTIDLIQQIRNTGKEGKDDDFIFSPVRDGDGQNGEHFDSRKAGKDMPNSGDANGAYNIARKGLIMYEHIKMDIKKLYISDEEWDAWLAGKDIWEKWLLENRKKLK